MSRHMGFETTHSQRGHTVYRIPEACNAIKTGLFHCCHIRGIEMSRYAGGQTLFHWVNNCSKHIPCSSWKQIDRGNRWKIVWVKPDSLQKSHLLDRASYVWWFYQVWTGGLSAFNATIGLSIAQSSGSALLVQLSALDLVSSMADFSCMPWLARDIINLGAFT